MTRLTGAGVLALAPPPRMPAAASGGAAPVAGRPHLQPLVRFPAVGGLAGGLSGLAGGLQGGAATGTIVLPVGPQNPYPLYVLFAPGMAVPTKGVAALSGAPLPGGYVGIVVRLNRDSARHWHDGNGTANISVPVTTMSALRFGMYQGTRPRPRAEYNIEMRYLYPGNDLRAAPAATNVMVYGFGGEAGHGDVRMVVPKSPARQISDLVQQHNRSMPADGDVALLEWPTIQNPIFRLSLLERNSPLFQQSAAMIAAAAAGNQLIGGGCWLPPSMSPPW